MIRLVVDSTCDMPQAVIEKYGITVLPLQVVIGDKSYRDGIDITAEQLYKVMREGIVPQTAQIALADMEGCFRGICEAGDDLVFLSFSSAMSGTYQAACLVAAGLRAQFPKRKIRVVDSEGGCLATGLIAMQSARWIDAGKSFEDLACLMDGMIANIMHLFTLDSLDWLAKGGRLAKPAGFLGDVLNIKPILHVADKTMHVIKVVRGRKKTIATMLEMLKERSAAFPDQLIGITHTDSPDEAAQIQRMIARAIPSSRTIVLPIGCVLATHLGIGGVGLFFLKQFVAGYDLLEESAL